ncbi:uncharacterized protein [Amphiura filiformis]
MQAADIGGVIDKIQEELAGSGQCLGYRAMWHRLKTTHQLRVDKETVRFCLTLLDPQGVESRRRHRLRRRVYESRGPLYCVHVDGYDKLKPFGFAIHGAICGFSRKILWLRVGRSNNNPKVVGSYYLDCLNEIDGVPRKIRFDRGTENGVIEDIQKSLRWNHADRAAGPDSVQIGASTSNQRIEQWWGTFRKGGIQFWMDLFKDMEDENLYSKGDELHRECLCFCFMGILQQELDQVKAEWNCHRMQRSRGVCPAGKPNILFASPEAYGAESFKFDLPAGVIQAMEVFVQREDPSGTHGVYLDAFNDTITIEGLQLPENVDEALELYGRLLAVLN